MEQYYFFLKGPFGQWYPSKFILDEHSFSCVEQYMMWAKAILFDDQEMAETILLEKTPKNQKLLGRQIRYFDQTLWDEHKEKIVFKGNLAKFVQNQHLKTILLSTGDKLLVECNPFDSVWGIGLSETDPRRFDPSHWKGENLLGKILTDVRNRIRTLEKHQNVSMGQTGFDQSLIF